jgi:hypothetical protein
VRRSSRHARTCTRRSATSGTRWPLLDRVRLTSAHVLVGPAARVGQRGGCGWHDAQNRPAECGASTNEVGKERSRSISAAAARMIGAKARLASRKHPEQPRLTVLSNPPDT